MKTQPWGNRFIVMLVCMVLVASCRDKQVKQYGITVTHPDGSTIRHTMVEGSLLFIHDGTRSIVAKATSASDSVLGFQVVHYSSLQEGNSKTFTIKKQKESKHTLALAKSTGFDLSGNVKVTLTSMAMIDTGRRPRGACQGNCCEATCFSTFCCSDPDECKNAPCDCKPTTDCPGNEPTPQPSRFFELFRSGKETLLVKE